MGARAAKAARRLCSLCLPWEFSWSEESASSWTARTCGSIGSPRKLQLTRLVPQAQWICYLQRPEHRYRMLPIGLATHSCARAQLAVEVIRLQTAPSRLANMLASTAILGRDCRASK